MAGSSLSFTVSALSNIQFCLFFDIGVSVSDSFVVFVLINLSGMIFDMLDVLKNLDLVFYHKLNIALALESFFLNCFSAIENFTGTSETASWLKILFYYIVLEGNLEDLYIYILFTDQDGHPN